MIDYKPVSYAERLARGMAENVRGTWSRADAAAELRRLDAVNLELLEALKVCADRLQIHMQHSEDLIAHMQAVKAIAKATDV